MPTLKEREAYERQREQDAERDRAATERASEVLRTRYDKYVQVKTENGEVVAKRRDDRTKWDTVRP